MIQLWIFTAVVILEILIPALTAVYLYQTQRRRG